MSMLIIRPIRDLLLSPSYIKSSFSRRDENEAKEIAEKMIKSAFRITISASAVFFIIKSQSSVPAAAVLGTGLSLPCALVAGGGWLLYNAGTAAKAALATGSFKSVAIAIASFVGGYCALEYHENWLFSKQMSKTFCEVGVLEWFLISPAAESWKDKVSSWFKPQG